jgi:hypothetical protein
MKSLAITVCTALGLAALATPATANSKFYPGTLCSIVSTTPNTTSSPNPSYYPTGAVHNVSTSTGYTFVCPIVRDEVRGDGLGWASLKVNVLNLTAVSDVLSCTATTFYPNDYGLGQISSGGVGRTDWVDLSFGNVSVPSDGYIILTCNIPRRSETYPSGIASYRIDE